MAIKKRAINERQKEKRRQDILTCGLNLFAKSDYEHVSMAQVAECAGMAKGTVFLYFKTKEELFLGITYQAFEKWFDDLDAILLATKPSQSAIPRMMNNLKKEFQKHKQLVRLIAFSHIILEHNVSYDCARAYKFMLVRRLHHTGQLMEKTIPFLTKGQGNKLLQWMYALVIGFGHMAEPSPIIKKVYENEPILSDYLVDFNLHFFDALQSVLTGWQAQSKKRG